jgi:hypothetical protein
MNKDTMSKRATLALSGMAAKIENRNSSQPTADAIDTIDDVLSLATNMELLGNETRTYNNKKDPFRGSFCTVPVRYEFENTGLKFKAEKVLRKTCGVNCSTPYPLAVRECIKQIVTVVKNRYPGNFVRVQVDTKNMLFRVACKPPKDAEDPRWKYREPDVPIPELALDLSLRKIPSDFKLNIPDSPTKRNDRRGISDMDVADPESGGASTQLPPGEESQSY